MAKTGASLARGKSDQAIETPWEFIRAVEGKFGPIKYDLACTEANCKGQFGIYEEVADSLKQRWHVFQSDAGDGRGWYQPLLYLNPPFDPIAPWVRKCAEEAALGACILLLHRLAADSNWFWDYVWPNATVYALTPRLKFVGQKDVYPFPLALSAFNVVPQLCRPANTHAQQLFRWHWDSLDGALDG